MKTNEQIAQECAARCLMDVFGANNVIERRAEYLALTPIILAAMREVCEPLMADSEALDFAMAECNKLRAALTVAEGALNALKENDPEENRQHADEIANKALARIAKLRK